MRIVIKLLLVSFLILTVFSFPMSHKAYAATTITSCAQLQAAKDNLDEDYILGSDINCDIAPYNADSGFEPIGTNGNPFTGTFDGDGYTISGLFIDRSANYIGLFGQTQNATIENIALESISITGNSYVGGLVGYAMNGTNISEVYVTGDVSGSDYAGGLAGYNGGAITNTYSEANVDSDEWGGGLIGFNVSADINSSYATGNVSGGDNLGGFVGSHDNGTIQNSYATGNVSGGDNLGGFVGYAASGNITNVRSVGSPLYGDIDTAIVTGTAGVALSLLYQTDPLNSVYTTSPIWNFSSVWEFENTSSLPILRLFVSDPTPTTSSGGGVTSSSTSYSCGIQSPGTMPDLFQINTTQNTATLYFTPVSGNVSGYAVSYGITPDANQYGTTFNYGSSTGVISYTINALYPGTWYFRVVGLNGCASGNWGNTVRAAINHSSATYFSSN